MLTSTLVEAKVTKTDTLSTPKQILFDFMEVYFEEFKKCANSFDQNSFENDNEERQAILAKCKV